MMRQLRSLGGVFIKPRLRRELAAFLHSAENCRAAQQAALRRILWLNEDSRFSHERRLDASLTSSEFRRRVPVGDFETIRPYVERLKRGEREALLGPQNKLLMFCLSSGTTSESKFIPVTTEFLKDYKRGWQIWGIRAFDAHPAVYTHDIVQLISDYDRFRTPAGTPCGNISGLVGAMQSPLVRLMYAIPQLVSKIADADAKAYVTLRFAVANEHIGLVTTANPSTLIQLARLADRERDDLIRDIADGTISRRFAVDPGIRAALSCRLRPLPRRAKALERIVLQAGQLRPSDFWPRLALAAIWTGGSAGAYLQTLRRFYGDVPVRDHGLSASEGRMTIPLEDSAADGVLDVDSHYFEFIPEEERESSRPTILEAHELEEGRNYFILLTTVSGLYRYDIQDVVRCTGFWGTTPRLEFLHKGAHIANLTGEKVTESQVVAAIRQGVHRFQTDFSYYSVSPVWGEPPYYRLHVEEQELAAVPNPQELIEYIDAALQSLNCEYEEKRKTGRLAPLEWCALNSGTWRRFTRHRQSRFGGSVEQYKHPCLVPDLQFSERLQTEFAAPAVETRAA
jgi:hypothetical protein